MSDDPGPPLAGVVGAERIVDAHVHVWPHAHPHAAPTWHRPHLASQLLATLAASGVDAAVQVTPSPERWDNEYGLASVAQHPELLGVFGRIDPAAPEPEERLARWTQRRGAAGVRLTFFGLRNPCRGELQALDPFWAAAERLGTAISLFAPDSLREAPGVLERHPRLRLIVDHMGLGVYPGCEQPFSGLRALDELAPFEQVKVKVSGLCEVSRERFPFVDVHEHLARAVETFGAERLIWGSNHPVVTAHCSYSEALGYLRHCEFLSADDLRWMLGETILQTLEETPASLMSTVRDPLGGPSLPLRGH